MKMFLPLEGLHDMLVEGAEVSRLRANSGARGEGHGELDEVCREKQRNVQQNGFQERNDKGKESSWTNLLHRVSKREMLNVRKDSSTGCFFGRLKKKTASKNCQEVHLPEEKPLPLSVTRPHNSKENDNDFLLHHSTPLARVNGRGGQGPGVRRIGAGEGAA